MRYSTQPRERKYVKGYDFLSFAKKYGKKSMDTATKTAKTVRMDAAKEEDNETNKTQ